MQITMDGLRGALHAQLGSVLTPETVAAILCAAVDRADRAIDPTIFRPEQRGELTFAVESFRDVLPELEPLHAAHFAETERHLAGFSLAADYDYMAERERMGGLLQFTARDAGGALVGNLRMYVNRSLHTGNLFAEEDTFYLLPRARRGRNAINFVRYAEAMLVHIVGVDEIRADTKTANGADKLFRYMGYTHVASKFIKIIKRS
jgi:hypothetical protein